MKYPKENVTEAKYTEPKGNPFLEAMPELMDKTEFINSIKSEVVFPKDIQHWSSGQRRNLLMELEKWFQPMDYMYCLYDMLYRAMASTYQTKTVIESVKSINRIQTDFRTGQQTARQYSTQAYNGSFLGASGIGKTSTLKRCLDLMPQVLIHKQYQQNEFYTKQINYLIVECPFDCSVKTLTFSILAAIDKAIGSDYFSRTANIRSISTSALTTKLKIICLNHYIGLIVIDEIQNAIQTAIRNKQTRPLIKFLLELTNETSTGICFCGTLEAEELFSSQEYLKRRTRGFRILPLKYDICYRRFITELWEHQATLRRTEPTEKIMKQLYDLSGGVPAYIVKIFEEAQIQAIQSGIEKVSYESIKQAMSFLGINIPKVYSREGTSISDFSVQEVKSDNKQREDEMTHEKLMVCAYEEVGRESLEHLGTSMPPIHEQKNKDSEEFLDNKAQTQDPETGTPVKRFYAVARGRKPSKRDETDLMVLWKANNDAEAMIVKLESLQMLERRMI